MKECYQCTISFTITNQNNLHGRTTLIVIDIKPKILFRYFKHSSGQRHTIKDTAISNPEEDQDLLVICYHLKYTVLKLFILFVDHITVVGSSLWFHFRFLQQ